MDAERPFFAKRMPTHSPEWDAASSVIKRVMRLTAELVAGVPAKVIRSLEQTSVDDS